MLNQGCDGSSTSRCWRRTSLRSPSSSKGARVPADAIVGANLPGYPSIGADNYGASVLNGQELGKVGKKRFAGQVPYAVVAAEPSAGAIVMQRYFGAVAGASRCTRRFRARM